jgi:hypothetical protein
MTSEQKKIALVAVAGGGGLILLLYLLRSGTGAGTNALGIGTAAPLQIPPGSDITYNFPGFPSPTAVTAEVPAIPSCVKLCDQCDDSTAFAGVASYQIPQSALNQQLRRSFVATSTLNYPVDMFAPVSETWGTRLGDILFG